MRQRNSTEYISEGEFLALRDVSKNELKELYKLLSERLGKAKVNASTVPGGTERREYQTPEKDDIYAKLPLNSWIDIWQDTTNAGRAAYITASSRLHQTVEAWGQAKPKTWHITAHLKCSLPEVLEDSLCKN